MDPPLKIDETETEVWMPSCPPRQMVERPSVLQQTSTYLLANPLPSPVATTTSEPLRMQYPALIAQLTAPSEFSQSVNHNLSCSLDGISLQPPFTTDNLGFSNAFGSNLFQPRATVLQHASNSFDLQTQLFPFHNYLGFSGITGITGMTGQLDAADPFRFNSQFSMESTLKDDPSSSLFSNQLTQEDLLFGHFNSISTTYNTVSLESILKDQKKTADVPAATAANTSSASTKSAPVIKINEECQVCQITHANGIHFGARTCAACAAFFRRTISDNKKYVCKRSQRCNNPQKDNTGYRKICRACRLRRCMDIGMIPESVQHKRTRADTPSRFEQREEGSRPPQGIVVTTIPASPTTLETAAALGYNPFRASPFRLDLRPTVSMDSMFPLYNQLGFGHVDFSIASTLQHSAL